MSSRVAQFSFQTIRSAAMLIQTEKDELAVALAGTYFSGCDSAYKATEAFQRDVADHIDGRYNHFADCVMPWLRRHMDIRDHAVVEVGSGTGSSTAAIAPHVRQVDCFEIDESSIAAAQARARILGYVDNVAHHKTTFDAHQALKIRTVDGVFLPAVLEHCTFSECIGLLRAAWTALRSGGWLCVVDTPNRLCPLDHHTSFLPFFASLPIEVRSAYASRSPRPEFARQFADPSDSTASMRLTRWGCGISYHEFEIAIGDGVHRWMVADGWEPEINAALGILQEDLSTELQVKMFAPHVHRAFGRRALYFVVRKED